jgi:hypothetical protein
MRRLMQAFARRLVREPGVATVEQYRKRVYRLARIYAGLFGASLLGIALLIWQGQFYVTLTQRSNVETLTLLFLLVFFGYVAVLSFPGATGAARIAYFWLLARLNKDRRAIERRKLQALGPPGQEGPVAALNLVLEREGAPCRPFELHIADEIGPMGVLRVDGARVVYVQAPRRAPQDVIAFLVEQINALVAARGVPTRLDVVEWKEISDEDTERYLNLVQFARNLERRLSAHELWPKLVLREPELHELERRLAAICPALRDEAFLPDWEYEGEHKVPIIPEPLGLLSLGRRERRVDPLASMGCALIIVLGAVVILGLFILFPPWVPGT